MRWVGGLSRALVSRRPGAVLDLLCSLPRAQPQGVVFNYSTSEDCLLGALVAAATGRPLADYCAETIWGPASMQADAYWGRRSPVAFLAPGHARAHPHGTPPRRPSRAAAAG